MKQLTTETGEKKLQRVHHHKTSFHLCHYYNLTFYLVITNTGIKLSVMLLKNKHY